MRANSPTISRQAQVFYRILLVAVSNLLLLALLWPFIPALTGLGLLSMATSRAHTALLRRTNNRTSSALMAVLVVALCIVIPVGLLLQWIAVNAVQAFTFFRTPVFWQGLQRTVAAANAFAAEHGFQLSHDNLPGAVQRLLNISAAWLMSVLAGSIGAFTQIIAMLFLLFFWYRDGDRIRQRALGAAPFSRAEIRFIVGRLRNTIKGTVVGRLIVAAIQGALAWATFWSLRIPGPGVLGCLTAVCAVLPAVGAYIVWLPVVLYLLLLHAWARAIILLIIGSAILSTVDNLLFPIIAGSRTRMETAQIFLALFGGMWVFGVSGLILGPIIWNLAESLLLIASRSDTQNRTSLQRLENKSANVLQTGRKVS